MKFLERRGALLLLLPLAVLLVYSNIFTSARLPGGDLSDTVSQGYPFMTFTEESIREGHLPHWNPYVFCGIPFYSSFSAPVFYPVRGLLLLLGGTEVTVRFLFPIHMLLGGLFAWMFLGSIGTSRWGRIVGALAFAMTAWSNTLFYAGHGSKIICWSFLPLLLYSVERWMRTKRGIFIALGGSAIGVMALASHPQMLLYSAGAAVIWAGFRAFSSGVGLKRGIGRAAAGIAVIILLGGAIGAVQLLPGYNFSAESSRGEDLSLDRAASYSLPPEESLTMLFPHLFGYRHGFQGSTLSGVPLYFGRLGLRLSSEFVGVSIFLLALAAWFGTDRRYRWPLLAIAAAGLLISWGGYTPIFGLLYRIVPVFRKLRAPHMAAFLTTSAIALAAGPGFDAVFRGDRLRQKRLLIGLGGFIGACLLVFLFSGTLLKGLQSGWWRNAGIPGGTGYASIVGRRISDAAPDFLKAAGAATVLAGMIHFRKKLAGDLAIPGLILVLIAGLELIPVDRDFQVFLNTTDAEDVFSVPDGLADETGSGRLLQGGNEFVQSRIRSVSGYHAAKPAVVENLQLLMNTGGVPAFRQTAYTILQAENSFMTYAQVRETVLQQALATDSSMSDELEILLPSTPLPRAFFAESWVILDENETLEALALGSDPARVTILDSDPGLLSSWALPGEAVLTEDGSESVVIRTENSEAGLLVLADTWYPRWRVTVDGEEAQLLRANYWQRAVAVPAGVHEVEFSFDSSDVGTGLLISLIGLAGALALVLTDLLVRRKRSI